MKITENMLQELNDELKNRGCAFRYKMMNCPSLWGIHDYKHENVYIQRIPMSDTFIIDCNIKCTPDFYEFLDDFFRKRGIGKLSYNNDHSICWSASGYDDIKDMRKVRCISEPEGFPQIKLDEIYYICDSSRNLGPAPNFDMYIEVYADLYKKQYIGNVLYEKCFDFVH